MSGARRSDHPSSPASSPATATRFTRLDDHGAKIHLDALAGAPPQERLTQRRAERDVVLLQVEHVAGDEGVGLAGAGPEVLYLHL